MAEPRSRLHRRTVEPVIFKRRGLMMILDGLGDRPVAALGGATPLEAAHTPNMDDLAERGQCGLVDPCTPGIPAHTHNGTGVLLGAPLKDMQRLARGPVEAAGIGLSLPVTDVAVRCNLATLEQSDDGLRVLDRRAGRIHAETETLCALLTDVPLGNEIRGSLHPATQHRVVMQLSGPRLSGEITDTDPGSQVPLPAPVLLSRALSPGDEAATLTAKAVNRFAAIAFDKLVNHPVNLRRQQSGQPPATGIISREAGCPVPLRSVIDRLDLRTAVIAGECTIIGIANLLGFTTITTPQFTSTPQTDLAAKVATARSALEQHDLVILHIKGTDVCAHDRDWDGKRRFLERIDASIEPLLSEDLVIGISADHSTDSTTGTHIGDPVPSLLYAEHGRRDRCRRFGEGECTMGGLGRITGTTYLFTLLDAMGCLHDHDLTGGI